MPGLAGLAVLAGVIAVACSALVFPYLSSNSDEGSYLSQGEALAAGHLLTPAPDVAPASFRPWLSVERDGSFIFKFTPSHASVLGASDVVFGSPVPALAVIAAASVVLLALLVTALGGSHRAGLGAGALLMISPAWIVQSGTYLPYLSNLALLLAAALGAAKGAARGRAGWFVLSGAAWGAAFFGRQFDAVLMLVPLAVIVVLGRRSRPPTDRSLVPAAIGFVAGVVPFIILLGAYDHVATGSVTKLPFNLLERSDTVGFGRRRVQSRDQFVVYTPKAALHAGLLNGYDLVRTMAGSAVLVAIAAYGLLRDRRLPGRVLWLTLGAVWVTGYFFFWGSYAVTVLADINTFLGPIYYLPAMVAVIGAAALTLDRLGRRRPQRATALVAVVALVSLALAVPLLANDLRRTDKRSAVAEAINDTVPGNRRSLLLTSPVFGIVTGHPLSWLRNQPDYGGDRVVAVHDPATDFAILDRYRDRSPFLISLLRSTPVPAVRAVVEPISRLRAEAVVLAVTGPALRPGWHRTVTIGRGTRPEWWIPSTGRTVAIEVRAGPDGIGLHAVSGLSSAPDAAPRPATTVTIGFRDTDGHGRVRTSERRIPVRAVDGSTEVLLPGQLSADQLDAPLEVAASAPKRSG